MQNFKDIKQLQVAVENDENFNHEIRGKRIRKQLSTLKEIQEELEHQSKVYFQEFLLDSFGITFKLKVINKEFKVSMELKIDHQYPFNRPQIYYTEHELFGQCKDLLYTILGPDNLWGPSMMLSGIIQKLPELARNIQEFPNEILWEYHNNEEYSQSDLEGKKVKLFKIDQYEWRFLIKSTKKRIVGLTSGVLMIFQEKSLDHLLLEDWIRISNIKQAKTILKDNSIELNIQDGRKNPKIYLGNSPQLEDILEFLDPIQMSERRIANGEKTGKFSKETVISDYSRLIEFYSLNNKEKSLKYMQGLTKIIAAEYDKAGEKEMVENK